MKKYYFVSYVATTLYGSQQTGNTTFEAEVLPSEEYLKMKIAQSSAVPLKENHVTIINMMELPVEDYKSFVAGLDRNKVLNGEKLLTFLEEQARGYRQTEFKVVLIKRPDQSDEVSVYTTAVDGYPQPSTQYSRAYFSF